MDLTNRLQSVGTCSKKDAVLLVNSFGSIGERYKWHYGLWSFTL